MLRITIIVCALLLICAPEGFAIKRYTLDELKQHEKFEVSVEANGNYSGNSIELLIKSTNRKDVELLIPTGTVFYTSDESDQILIVVEEQLLVIAGGKSKRKVLDGFCTEASDGIPTKEMEMSYMPTKREKLQSLANYINENKGFSDHAIQEAVWCVSDGHSLANIYDENAAKTKKLTQFVADLTGQEITWHKVKRNLGSNGDRIMVNPVFVTGLVQFSTSKETTLKSKIVDENGELVYENPKSMTIPKKDRVELDFNLSVAGWENGNYSVIYYDQDNQVILKKEFSI